eukprot:6181993-Pleurochrysis_carterae.AAC.4
MCSAQASDAHVLSLTSLPPTLTRFTLLSKAFLVSKSALPFLSRSQLCLSCLEVSAAFLVSKSALLSCLDSWQAGVRRRNRKFLIYKYASPVRF